MHLQDFFKNNVCICVKPEHNKNMKTLLLCIEIFLARMLDVSIGSVRTIFLVKQRTVIASIFAFVEIIIWFLVAQQR